RGRNRRTDISVRSPTKMPASAVALQEPGQLVVSPWIIGPDRLIGCRPALHPPCPPPSPTRLASAFYSCEVARTSQTPDFRLIAANRSLRDKPNTQFSAYDRVNRGKLTDKSDWQR